MISQKLPPIHPGKILQDHFFEPRNLTIKKVAQDINIPVYQLEDLISNKASITPEIAYRLSCYFQIEPEVFLSLQQHYDLEVWKDRQEFQVKQKLIEKKNNPNLGRDQKKLINDLLTQASKTENVN